jgi:hypothetical protein
MSSRATRLGGGLGGWLNLKQGTKAGGGRNGNGDEYRSGLLVELGAGDTECMLCVSRM